ncbi:LamG-like jellyroll fold domain-containing protein [Microbacterium sp. SD291]|uniref:LamG-like jellyroll fold domain-containing protein n=1 Tax=Microbacterium sp. SD291 TaxID=2782007 RepID=UPI001A96EAC2|nr:LamG-like jellyroll fold domain-containing protein [Microbacterium sp. SD291]MBO0981321.1 family 43 glycosylhydrolase [Microbacterium sp. SD291]
MSRPARTPIALATAGAIAIGCLVAAPAWAKPPAASPEPPQFQDVTVHDPSIVTSGEEIWAFGSHGASAHTTDLIDWEQHTVDLSQDADNALFEDIYTELADTFEWANTRTLWAADVIQLPDGRFAMYYNACEGSSPRSALGIATADAVDGPYENQGILLKSGMSGESENPGEVYDARLHPNAVDPDVFYDAEGDLWMVYGSYSGGIHILRLDPATGEPLPDQGYGKHLVGGNHSRIEAPTIQYDAESGYYYLYLSFGGLDASGGYDVRVARSTAPDGPYLDAEGNDMADVKSDPALPLFDDASIQPYGVKLMGGHLFTRKLGDAGTGAGIGYVSPGHNSWYQDPETGRMFLVFHARFPGSGESHEVRVHQVWINEDGWPVISPQRYAGETAGKVYRSDVIGDWQLVNMGKDITAAPAASADIVLTKNGRITGDANGSWILDDVNTTTLTIDGEVYTGSFVPVWDPALEAWSTGFTALSEHGVSVWGRKVPTLSDADAVAAVVAALDLGDTSAITGGLALPTEGTSGTVITWESSDASVVATDGSVTRPAIGSADARVTLTATVAAGDVTQSVSFDLTVLARTPGVLAGAWSFENDLSDGAGLHPDASTTGARLDTSGAAAAFVADGVSGSAIHLDGASGVRLPTGLIHGSEYTVSVWLRPDALTTFTSAFFGATSPESWISLVPQGHSGVGGSAMLWSGTRWYDAGTGRTLPLGEWSHVAFTVDGGSVSVYVDGVESFHGTGFPDVFSASEAEFGVGVNWWDAPFSGDVDELNVWSTALTAEDIAELAIR